MKRSMFWKGICSAVVTVVRKGHGVPSSNRRRPSLYFTRD